MWVIVTVFQFIINHPFSSFKRLDSIPRTMTRPQAGKLRKCGPIPDRGMALFCSPKCSELLLNHPTLPFNRYQELFPSKVTITWGWPCTSITASPPALHMPWQHGYWFSPRTLLLPLHSTGTFQCSWITHSLLTYVNNLAEHTLVHISIMDSILRPSCNTVIRITLAEKNEVLYTTILVWMALFIPQCSQKFLWKETFRW